MAFDTLDIGDGIVLAGVQPEDAREIFALIDSNRDYLRKTLGSGVGALAHVFRFEECAVIDRTYT